MEIHVFNDDEQKTPIPASFRCDRTTECESPRGSDGKGSGETAARDEYEMMTTSRQTETHGARDRRTSSARHKHIRTRRYGGRKGGELAEGQNERSKQATAE